MISPVSSSFVQLELFEAPKQGLQRAQAQANDAAQRISAGEVSPEAMVDLLEAETLAKANAATLRAADDMIGSLFDKLA
jgi:hypothetical protein